MLRRVPFALLAVAVACSPASPPRGGPPEVLENVSAFVDEREIRAVTDGPIAEVGVLVAKRGTADLVGTLRAELLDVTGGVEDIVLSSAATPFTQDATTARHTLRLAGLPDGMSRAEAAGLVLRWVVETPAGELYGRRSLHAALGTLEVQLRGATEMVDTTHLTVVARGEGARAVAGAEVQVELLDEAGPVELASGRTDARGELDLELGLPEGRNAGDVRVTVRQDAAQTWMTATLTRVKDERIRLALDKTIYKPGQNLHLRLVGLRTRDLLPLDGRSVVVEAKDGRGNKVFKATVETDALGVAAVDVPTDTRVNEGDWRLSATMGETRAEITVPVIRYNLPKLRVDVNTEQAYLQPGQTLRGSVQARYLFGMPVLDGRVQVQAKLGDAVVAQAEGRTDAAGAYTFALTVPAAYASSIQERATLTVQATVTDPADQTEQGASGLPLVAAPLVIRVLPEAGALVSGLDNQVHVLISDPLGRPVVATVDIGGAATATGLVTDRDGVVTVPVMGPAAQTQSELTVTARDGADRTASRTVQLAAQDGLLVRTDRSVYTRGDKVVVEVLAPAATDRVYIDVFQGAVGRARSVAAVTDGRARIEVTVDDKMQGGLLIDAYGLGASGEVFTGQRRLLARADDRLVVEILASDDTFAPGAAATVTVRALDAQGRPKVAAVGLYAVDEAVFALGGEPGDDLRTFFTLDPGLVSATANALGKTARDLAGLEPGAEADKVAGLLFAASGAPARPGLSFNSVAAERPVVRNIVLTRMTAQLDDFLVRLAEQGPDQDDILRLVEYGAKRLVDPFGRRFVVTVDADRQVVELRSSGPDERLNTEDDVEVSQTFAYVRYGSRNGEFDDSDALAGGAGNPGPPQNAGGAPPPEAPADGASAPARVRSDFRETVYANPWLVTDATGRATVSFPLADSITTWRLSADAHTGDGRLGSARLGVRTFQDFFVDVTLPTRLTVGDEIEVPAVVYNYLDTEQDVQVSLQDADWLTVLSSAQQTVRLAPSEVRAVRFRVRVEAAGSQALQLTGNAGSVSDALVRTVDVIPNGTPEVETVSNRVNGPAQHTLTMPADALAGGTRVSLSLTPGFAAEAVQGMAAMIREPSGCFEQTTATAWPNTLVALYLETTGQMSEEQRAEILPVIQRGYQRLLTFESPTGGFNWWGDADPGNRILSAIMLWHLADLDGLIETDPAVRDRTLAWMLAQQQADGHWASGDALHAGNETLGTDDVRTTAFITWALAHTGQATPEVTQAAGWIAGNLPDAEDLYANALSMNALTFAAPNSAAATTVLGRLDQLKVVSSEGLVSWPTDTPSWTGAGGEMAAIETTGLVTYGLYKAEAYPDAAAGAMRFIVNNKDAVGSWYNTQATMNALRALLAAASPRGSEADGTFTIDVNGVSLAPIAVTAANGDVYRTFDLTEHVRAGDNQVAVAMTGSGEVTYKLTREVYRPRAAPAQSAELSLGVTYDRIEASVGERIRAQVSAVFTGEGVRDQVMVRIGRAPGFAPDLAQLDALVTDARIARYETDAEFVTMYLMNLEGGVARDLSFDFTPGLAVTADAPTSEMYVYYEPMIRTEAAPVRFTVTAE